VKDKDDALGMELVTKRQVEDKRNAETWTLSRKRCEYNAWRDYISHEIDVSKQLPQQNVIQSKSYMQTSQSLQ
jgi:hypothetical protein